MVSPQTGPSGREDATARPGRPLLLSTDSVCDYLEGRGAGAPPYTHPETLAGGVSNIVVRVRTGGPSVVVKQSLEALAVADTWTAPTSRTTTEARVMELLDSITPGRLPGIVDHDEAQHALVMQAAPEDWGDWKAELMSGHVDQQVARALGRILATWHQQTLQPTEVLGPGFNEYQAFEALRVDPYFRTAAARAPAQSSALMSLVRDLASRRWCLVHGDFSPKNVLVGPRDDRADHGPALSRGLWVIDFEVAHRGDPMFDLGFMCSHLLMKSYALPEIADELDAARDAFVGEYTDAVQVAGLKGSGAMLPGQYSWLDQAHLSRVIGALLIARVKGKSPAGYLDGSAQQRVWDLGVSLLRVPAAGPGEITDRRIGCGG